MGDLRISPEAVGEFSEVFNTLHGKYPRLIKKSAAVDLGPSRRRKSTYINTVSPADAKAKQELDREITEARNDVADQINVLEDTILSDPESLHRETMESDLNKLRQMADELRQQSLNIWPK